MTKIAKSTDDPEKKNYSLDRIEDASTFLLGVINDILDMSKIENEKFELSCADFDFSAAIRRIINIFESRMEEKNQKLILDQDPDIPKWLNTDEHRLLQAVTNLMSNANKFTPNGGSITLAIRVVESGADSCLLEIRVTDTGIGIPQEQQEKLFMPFYQIDSAISRKYQGTGLGLVITKKIVDLMGGTIRIESEAGRGASFIFTIRAAIVSPPESDENENRLQDNQRDFSGKHILLAEDVDINREIVITVLEPLGLKITEAEDGRTAYDKFCADPDSFDLIFMDIHMPGIDGYETTKIIRAFNHPKAATIPIIAMTANVFMEDIKHCREVGMNSHIGKPLDFNAVMETLNRYL